MINEYNPDYSLQPNILTRKVINTNTPLVSIVIPVYNKGELLIETFSSILDQTFQNFELILVNDNSSDKQTNKILEKYSTKYNKKIKLVNHKKNKGPAAARNTGVKKSKGEFIFFMDADDLVEPTTLEKWVWTLITKPNASFVNSFSVGFGGQEYLWPRGYGEPKDFLEENRVTCTCLIRKSAFEEIGGYEESITGGLEDWEFWLKCASTGHWGVTIPEHHIWYRRKADLSDWDNWNDQDKYQKIKSKFNELYKEQISSQNFDKISESISDEVRFENFVPLKKDKPNIVFIIPWLNLGGSDKYNLDLLEWVSDSYNFTILTTLDSKNPWLSEFSKFTNDIHLLPNFITTKHYHNYIEYIVKSRNADLIFISNSRYSYNQLPYLKTLFPNIPVMDYIHMEEEYWDNGGYPLFSAQKDVFIDRRLVSSKHLKQWSEKRGASADKTFVVNTNIDIRKWKPFDGDIKKLRKELNLPPNKKVILFTGRFAEQKQPFVLLNSLLNLSKKDTNFVCVLCGDGELKQQMEEFIKQNNLSSFVILTGAIPNKEVKKYLYASDLYFLPSLQEGIALAIFEAMACGKVVLGAKVGGQVELVTPEVGILIDPSNPEQEIKEYTSHLIELVSNDNKLKKLGKAARKRIIDHFTHDKTIEKMTRHFDDMIKLRKNPDYSFDTTLAVNELNKEIIKLENKVEDIWGSVLYWKDIAEKSSDENHSKEVKINSEKNIVLQQTKNLEILNQQIRDRDKKNEELQKIVDWYKGENEKIVSYFNMEIEKINSWHENQYKNIPPLIRKIFKSRKD